MAVDYYEVLGIERDASDAQIKKAFRRLAQQWHPDVNKEDAADERFKAINEAYQILSDPERRQRYDLFGSAGVEGDVNAGFGGFTDIFDAFFVAAGGASLRGRPASGSELRYDLPVSLVEAGLGGEEEGEFSVLSRWDTRRG